MKLDKLKTKISAPFAARIALKFARAPKRIRRFAEFINAKVDLPGATEEEEEAFFIRTIGVALEAVDRALKGEPFESALSNRDLVAQALMFLSSALDDFDAAEDGFAFVPDWIEATLAEGLDTFIEDVALAWVAETPRLH